jgi:intracellular septation protein A
MDATARPEVDPASVASAKAILLGSGPRFARDAFGPVLAFYLGLKLSGLVVGIVAATVVALAAWQWERRSERAGLMARISLGLVVLQAIIGLVADDAKVYLAQPVLISGLYGLVFIGSALIGRPLAGAFASEMHTFPPEVRDSATFRTVFGRVSLVWGVFLLARAGLRMASLSSLSIDGFVAASFVTGIPLTTLLLSWSVWYGRRGFERSEEFGWAFAQVPGPGAA